MVLMTFYWFLTQNFVRQIFRQPSFWPRLPCCFRSCFAPVSQLMKWEKNIEIWLNLLILNCVSIKKTKKSTRRRKFWLWNFFKKSYKSLADVSRGKLGRVSLGELLVLHNLAANEKKNAKKSKHQKTWTIKEISFEIIKILSSISTIIFLTFVNHSICSPQPGHHWIGWR